MGQRIEPEGNIISLYDLSEEEIKSRGRDDLKSAGIAFLMGLAVFAVGAFLVNLSGWTRMNPWPGIRA